MPGAGCAELPIRRCREGEHVFDAISRIEDGAEHARHVPLPAADLQTHSGRLRIGIRTGERGEGRHALVPIFSPVKTRMNVEDQQSAQQQYGNRRGISPMPDADRPWVPAVDVACSPILSVVACAHPLDWVCGAGPTAASIRQSARGWSPGLAGAASGEAFRGKTALGDAHQSMAIDVGAWSVAQVLTRVSTPAFDENSDTDPSK